MLNNILNTPVTQPTVASHASFSDEQLLAMAMGKGFDLKAKTAVTKVLEHKYSLRAWLKLNAQESKKHARKLTREALIHEVCSDASLASLDLATVVSTICSECANLRKSSMFHVPSEAWVLSKSPAANEAGVASIAGISEKTSPEVLASVPTPVDIPPPAPVPTPTRVPTPTMLAGSAPTAVNEPRWNAVLEYTALGLLLMPTYHNGKSPPKGFTWSTQSTTDHATIASWSTEYPNHGLGIVTGRTEGTYKLCVIDVDNKDGHNGSLSLKNLQDDASLKELPRTRMHSTPSGGYHLFFWYSSDLEIAGNASKIADGIDIRADGNLVVAPPTAINGKAYAVVDDTKIAALPETWVARLTAPTKNHPSKAPTPASNLNNPYAIETVGCNTVDIVAAAVSKHLPSTALFKGATSLPNNVKTMLSDPAFASTMGREVWMKVVACILRYGTPDAYQAALEWSITGGDKFDEKEFENIVTQVREGRYGSEFTDLSAIISNEYKEHTKKKAPESDEVVTAIEAKDNRRRHMLGISVMSAADTVDTHRNLILESTIAKRTISKRLIKAKVDAADRVLTAMPFLPIFENGVYNQGHHAYWATRIEVERLLETASARVGVGYTGFFVERIEWEAVSVRMQEVFKLADSASNVFILRGVKDAEYTLATDVQTIERVKRVGSMLAVNSTAPTAFTWKDHDFSTEALNALRAPHHAAMLEAGLVFDLAKQDDETFMLFDNEPSFDQSEIDARLAAFVRRMNCTMASVRKQGKAKIMRKTEEGHEWDVYAELLSASAKYTIQTGFKYEGKRRVPVYTPQLQAWKSHKTCLSFTSGIVFKPHPIDKPITMKLGVYNLWSGFTVDPKPASGATREKLDRIYWHIDNILCSGNPTLYQYVINWLAWKIQNPADLPKVAVVFRGKKGTGKSMLGQFIQKLYGIHGMCVGKGKAATGAFNEHLEDKLFLFVHEAKFDKDDAEIKNLIADIDFLLNGKFEKARMVKNYIQFMMASNEDAVVHATGDERRYAVCDVSPAKKENSAYFTKLWEAIDDREVQAAFLYDMIVKDLSGFTVDDAPESDGLKQQRYEALPLTERWIADSWVRGEFPSDGGVPVQWGEKASVSKLFDSCMAYSKTIGTPSSRIPSMKGFSTVVAQVAGKHRSNSGVAFCLPSLEEAKEVIEKAFKISLDY